MEDLSTLFPASSSEGLGDDLIALLGLSPSGGLGELADVDPLKQEPAGLATQPATFPVGPVPAIPKIELTPNWCLPAPSLARGGATSGAAMSVAESGQSAGEGEGSDDSQEESTQAGHSSGPKRRRRVRNAKQQELNRLAQQRYRMRKKQRQQDLQVTVDELGTQLAQLRAKDEEIKELRKEKLTLERTVLAQEAMLHTANAQLSSQARIIVEQERAMVEQKAASDKNKIDPAVLTEQLAAVLKEALAEMGETVDKQAVDKLTDKLRDKLLARSLSSSCRDARSLAALPKAPAEKPTPSITVSCC